MLDEKIQMNETAGNLSGVKSCEMNNKERECRFTHNVVLVIRSQF